MCGGGLTTTVDEHTSIHHISYFKKIESEDAMYKLSEFLQAAMTNCPIVLVYDDAMGVPREIHTCVNDIKNPEDMTFTCWDIQNGRMCIYID